MGNLVRDRYAGCVQFLSELEFCSGSFRLYRCSFQLCWTWFLVSSSSDRGNFGSATGMFGVNSGSVSYRIRKRSSHE
jgi:hypothetical protein